MKNMGIIDNRANISENSDKCGIYRLLVKSLKIKFLHPMKRFHENAISQYEKPQRAEK